MGFSFGHLVVVLIVVLIVFGAGKLPKVMGELGKGLKSFKDELNDNPTDKKEEASRIEEKK